MVGVIRFERTTSPSRTVRATELRHTPTLLRLYLVYREFLGLSRAARERCGHVPRPRNFAIENKFSSEDCLANCHWQFSLPSCATPRHVSNSYYNTSLLFRYGRRTSG